jgi:hypothetical protein
MNETSTLKMIVASRLKMVHESCVKAAAAASVEEKSKRGWDSVLHFLSDEIESLLPKPNKPLITAN